jgi:hypothetical protein
MERLRQVAVALLEGAQIEIEPWLHTERLEGIGHDQVTVKE